MFDVKIEGIERLDKTIVEMIATLKKFGNEDIPNEFFNWEAEDLRRKSSQIKRVGRRKSYRTTIRPHSAASMRMRHKALVHARRHHRSVTRGSTLPILRPSLWKQLVERMTTLMVSKIRWR